MSRPERFPLGRLAAEFVVLVVGVLVALGVDRWVAGIDEREQEFAYLTELRTDFVMNRALAENGTRDEWEMAKRKWFEAFGEFVRKEAKQEVFDNIQERFGYNWMKEDVDKFNEIKTQHLGNRD